MARIWKEPYDSVKHHVVPIEYWGNTDDHLRAPGLIPKDVVMVHVASFTFQFMSVQQLRDCLFFFEQKIHPSSRRQCPLKLWQALTGKLSAGLSDCPCISPKNRSVGRSWKL